MIWYICAKQFSEIPPNSYISPPLYHRRLLFKLDTLLRSHLVVEVIIQRGICTAPPPPILYSTPPSLMLRWMQNSTSRWCHQSVCLVLTIEVYALTYLTFFIYAKLWSHWSHFKTHPEVSHSRTPVRYFRIIYLVSECLIKNPDVWVQTRVLCVCNVNCATTTVQLSSFRWLWLDNQVL